MRDCKALYCYDDTWRARGFEFLCGVDEAGRGPLAGPVCAAAVILPPGVCIEGIDDSKKLSEKKREQLFDEITGVALAYGIAFVPNTVIDEINILNASLLAMKNAVEKLCKTPDIVLVDGNCLPDIDIRAMAVTGGDAKSASIAAASVLAKVSRDRLMCEIACRYPQYMFQQHKGYGTKMHYEMLEKYGVCDIHRKSFLKKLGAACHE